MKTKRFFFFLLLTKKIRRINVSTGSANGQDWGVIDFPRNQSACWESTARPDQTRAWGSLGSLEEKTEEERTTFHQLHRNLDSASSLADSTWILTI